MPYIERALERKFLRMSSFFKAVLVTGARQVGKTTMLKHLAEGQNRTYISMDNTMARTLAQTDPVLFFQTYKPPIIIDEIQKAPELFEQIKIMCDETEERGLFWLTGSQQYKMMKNIRDTLAGRIGILELYSFSKNEVDGEVFTNKLDFSLSCLLERHKMAKKNDIMDVFEHIWRGGMPDVLRADAEQRQGGFEGLSGGEFTDRESKGIFRPIDFLPVFPFQNGAVCVENFMALDLHIDLILRHKGIHLGGNPIDPVDSALVFKNSPPAAQS